MMQLTIIAAAAAVILNTAAGTSGGGGGGGAPLLVDTDRISASQTNGFDGNGGDVKFYLYNGGTSGNFGTTAGLQVWFRDPLGDNAWHEVAVYNYLQSSKATHTGIQLASVRLGHPVGANTSGHVYDLSVTLAGVRSNVLSSWFTSQVGNIWYVSPTGSDSTGVKNDINHPFANAQVWTGSTFTGICAGGGLAPGDDIVFLGGSYSIQGGYLNTVFRFATTSTWATAVGGGSAPTGVSGHGYVHFGAYQGSPGIGPDIPFFTMASGGGILGVESSFASSSNGHGWYVSVSGLKGQQTTTSARDACLVNGQNGAYFWRVYDNECAGWPTSSGTTNSGGLSGDFHNTYLRWNWIHDISGNLTDLQNHGIYCGGASGGTYEGATQNTSVFGNLIQNCTAGSGIQFYWQNTNSVNTSVFTGCDIAGNFIDNTAKYGINCGQSSIAINVYNNVVTNCGLNALRMEGLNLAGQPTFSMYWVMNTVYGWNRTGSINDSAFVTEGYANNGTLYIAHNIFAGASGRSTTNSWYANTVFVGADSNISMSQNVYYDYAGTLTGSAAKDSTPITTSPNFTNRTSKDFTLGTPSSARQAVTTSEGFTVGVDIVYTNRPKSVTKDCGAYES